MAGLGVQARAQAPIEVVVGRACVVVSQSLAQPSPLREVTTSWSQARAVDTCWSQVRGLVVVVVEDDLDSGKT